MPKGATGTLRRSRCLGVTDHESSRLPQLRIPALSCTTLQSVCVRSAQSGPSSPLRLRSGTIWRRHRSLRRLVLDKFQSVISRPRSIPQGVTFPPPRSLSPQCCATQKGFAARLKYAIDSAPINLRYPASEINRQPLATQDIRAPRHDNIPDGRHRVLTHVEGGRPQILILLTTTTSSLASIWRACRSPAGPSAAAFGHARTCFPPCSAFAGL
jgi:hypothetical protein